MCRLGVEKLKWKATALCSCRGGRGRSEGGVELEHVGQRLVTQQAPVHVCRPPAHVRPSRLGGAGAGVSP